MTISSTTRRAGPYSGNGVATSFAFSFKVFATSDISVVRADSNGAETTLVLNSDYSVTLNGDQNASPGGTVTYPISGSPLATGEKLAIVGNLEYSQTTQLPNGGAYNASVVERAMDRLTILSQQLKERVDAALKLPFTGATVSATLPAPVPSSVLGWDASGQALRNYDAAGLGVSLSYAQWQTQTFNGTGAQTAFVLSVDAGSASNIDLSVGGVTQVPGVNYTYTTGSRTINFITGAPPSGTNNVAARYGQGLAGLPDSVLRTTGSAIIPSRPTSGRDAVPLAGYFGFNSTLGRFEGYNGAAWGNLGGATGGGNDAVFYLNGKTVTQSFSIPADQNAGSFGPITTLDGVNITVPDGCAWTIV
jgi:hypothetical protein